MSTVHVTQDNFEELSKQPLVLLDFWASWCGPCRAFAPVFESAAARHPDVVFGKVDTDAEPALANAFQVHAIPTIAVMRDGVVLATQPGMLSGANIDALLQKVRSVDMSRLREAASEHAEPSQHAAATGGE